MHSVYYSPAPGEEIGIKQRIEYLIFETALRTLVTKSWQALFEREGKFGQYLEGLGQRELFYRNMTMFSKYGQAEHQQPFCRLELL